MLNDDGKLRRKYSNKRVNSAREGIEFKLSFDELCLLMKEAGIVLSNWGFTGGYYVLARFNDEGPYEYGNCRFITQYENMKEQKTTISQTVARRANIKKAFDSSNRQEGYDNYLKMRRKLSEERNRRRFETLDPSYRGEKNSQYGTIWITDGSTNRKIKKEEVIPEGWRKGRKILSVA